MEAPNHIKDIDSVLVWQALGLVMFFIGGLGLWSCLTRLFGG